MTTELPALQVETPNPPDAGRLSWRDFAVGTAVEAEEAVVALLAAVRRRTVAPAQQSGDRAADLVTAARRRIAETAERGAAEQVRARQRAVRLRDRIAAAAAASPVLDRVVDVQVDRVLRPLVVAVLDDVLGLLEREPERIQALIRGQREGMVDELVGRIRTGAAAGDTAVDRWTARVLRRNRQPAPAVDI
jgi:hypothetical protein